MNSEKIAFNIDHDKNVKIIKRFSKYLYVLLVGLFILVFLNAAYNILMDINDADSFILGYKPIIVGSDTMSDSIDKGSLVVVKKASIDKLRDQDVIAYMVDDNILVHRAYIDESGDVKTKGDANKRFNVYSITDEDLLGYVVYRVKLPGLSSFVDYLNNKVEDEAEYGAEFIFG